jgi:two-component system nitrate/nitrite response regulator NarL
VVAARVLIASPVRLYRDALAEILEREEELDVVGTAADTGELRAQVAGLDPDILLLDPAISGSIEAIREFGRSGARVKVVVLVSAEAEPDLIASAEAGASAFVTRDDSLAHLVAAITSATRGDLICSPKLAGTLLRRVSALAAARATRHDEVRLTTRELQVAQLLDVGLSNMQIANRLGVELPTVKHHVHHILDKLGVARRSEAVFRLRQYGLLPPAPS